jgi:hypothetical protein
MKLAGRKLVIYWNDDLQITIEKRIDNLHGYQRNPFKTV